MDPTVSNASRACHLVRDGTFQRLCIQLRASPQDVPEMVGETALSRQIPRDPALASLSSSWAVEWELFGL